MKVFELFPHRGVGLGLVVGSCGRKPCENTTLTVILYCVAAWQEDWKGQKFSRTEGDEVRPDLQQVALSATLMISSRPCPSAGWMREWASGNVREGVDEQVHELNR